MIRKRGEMKEKNKHHKGLVHLGEFKNKLVYYDIKGRKLYFSLPERTSKNKQYFILLLSATYVKKYPDRRELQKACCY